MRKKLSYRLMNSNIADKTLFTWPANISGAKIVQMSLREKVKIIPLKKPPGYIAGVDAAFQEDKVAGAVCLYRYPGLIPVEDASVVKRVSFPYIPGYLSFREGPVIVELIEKLEIKPDVIIFDGQGIAHPKGLGIASHIGVLLDLPTIGCAKSRLIGDYMEPGSRKGSWSLLYFNGTTVGAVLRTRDNVRPLFVSPGHRIDLQASIEIVLNCCVKYRIPEPIRRADSLAGRLKTCKTQPVLTPQNPKV